METPKDLAEELLDAMIYTVAREFVKDTGGQTIEDAAEGMKMLLVCGLLRFTNLTFGVEVKQDDGEWVGTGPSRMH